MATTFKDSLGESWSIELDLPTVRTIRKKLGLELLNPFHAEQVRNSLLDRLTIIYMLCEDQAKQREIDDDEFENRVYFHGIAEVAGNALVEELAAFFRRLGMSREAMNTAKQLEVMKKAQALDKELIESGRLEAMMEKEKNELVRKLAEIAGDG